MDFKKILKKIRLYNVKVKNKFIIIYTLCFLLPLIINNFVVLRNFQNVVNEYKLEVIENSLDRMIVAFDTKFIEAVYVSDVICSDRIYNELLDKNFSSSSAYINEYGSFIRNYLPRYLTSYKQIERIRIYSENPTIVYGGDYYKIDENVKASEWYELIEESEQDLKILMYSQNGETMISLIRKMIQYNDKNYYQKILRLDFDIGVLEQIIEEENAKANVILSDDSGNELLLWQNIADQTEKNSGLILFDKELSIKKYLKGWRINAYYDKSIFAHVLQENIRKIVILAVLNFFFISVFVWLIISPISRTLTNLAKHFKENKNTRLKAFEGEHANDELGNLVSEFNNLVNRINTMIHDIYETKLKQSNLEVEKKQAELKALQSQINPHFLYNVLNVVKLRCVEKGETETADIISNMSRIYRNSIKWDSDVTTIADEITIVKSYLAIQKYRFEESLKYEINIEESLMNCKIVKLCIQTLVENSCEHGTLKTREDGKISINVFKSGDTVCCEVKDNGIGMEETELKAMLGNIKNEEGTSPSVGLKNVYRRLKFYYNTDFTFDVRSTYKKGMKVRICFPKEY